MTITLPNLIENVFKLIFVKKISALIKIYQLLTKTYFKKRKML